MKKKICIGIIVCVFLIVTVIILHFKTTVPKAQAEKLYTAIENIITQENDIDTELNGYKSFISMKKLGTKIKGDTTYVYVWLQVESFYINSNSKVECYQGLSIPYRFTFENGNYIKYDIPQDGEEYDKSIKKIFPLNIRIKFNNIYSDDYLKQDILNQVEDYYGISYDEICY